MSEKILVSHGGHARSLTPRARRTAVASFMVDSEVNDDGFQMSLDTDLRAISDPEISRVKDT